MKNLTVVDSSRNLRHTRLILLSTLFCIGLTGCCLVLLWLLRSTRQHMRSARICSLILNLVVANCSVYIFATGIQIFWEFQTNRQWPFNDFLCRLVKFFQSFSILSSSYIIVAMAIDRCIAIVTPLKAGKIRVLYLCGSAWFLAGFLSTPNVFIFHLQVNNHSERYCTAIFNQQSTPTGRRIYLTFISLFVYFIPFVVLVLCYTLIFIKLLCRERIQENDSLMNSSSLFCCSWCMPKSVQSFSQMFPYSRDLRISSNCSSLNDCDIGRKRANTYAKARSKTFRMIVILVLCMIIFGAPYYCLELYIAYTGRQPSDYVLALAGGAAVAPSSIDPWIFLLFWVNWNEPAHDNHQYQSRRLLHVSAQYHHPQMNASRRSHRSNTMGSISSNEAPHHRPPVQLVTTIHLSPPLNKEKRAMSRIQTQPTSHAL